MVGAVFIGEIADVYYGGIAADPNAPAFTPDALRTHLIAPFVLLFVWIAVIICAYIVFQLYPAPKAKSQKNNERALSILLKKTPKNGTSVEFINARKGMDDMSKARAIVWSAAFVVCLVGAIYVLVYLFDPAHFNPDALHDDTMGLVRHVISFMAASFVALLAAAGFEAYSVKRQLDFAKIAVKTGDKDSIPVPEVKYPISKKTRSTVIWVTRACVGAIAIAFIVAGALNGGANDTLVKAINICTECIGLG